VRGIERNKAIITAAAEAKLLWYIQRFSPGLVRALFSRGFSGAMRKAKTC
jgi:hypothetical protein